ncbi:MAG: hypothetical protein C4532_08850 [Candidatus Abyssobacteria bacterium SURF_17]|uniref:Uncharacterized protein n=1 Tax=Candidatus Abyssobacteria bacterium SURF_17 TaxID=2093361 RepID=A0A419EZC1_9BACT|nr:MAG: hypothetical protein C4532_08850 [Candidatus Abyssubacteria bacterium SURF_17]
MATFRPRIALPALVIIAALTASFSDPAMMKDLDVLKRALAKSLGERSNTGANRIAAVRKSEDHGRDTLLVVLNANSSPTTAGLRHGILDDTATVLEVAKSWGWPDKVDQVIVTEHFPLKGKDAPRDPQPIFVGAISSSKVREVDWGTIDRRKIPEMLDGLSWHGSLE